MATFKQSRKREIFADPECVSREALRRIRELLEQKKGKVSLALSGGSTPKRLYQMLAESDLPLDRLELFWGDERAVPHDHPDSNYRMVKEALLDKAKIPAAQVHPWPYKGDAAASALAYEKELIEHFGSMDKIAFDLVLLGMGDDGHTASLFPGSWAVKVTEHAAVANQVKKLNTFRLTMTLPVFRRSGHVLFLVCGSSKADVLNHVLHGDDYPSARVECAGGVTFLVDEAAATRLPHEVTTPKPVEIGS